MIKVSIKKNEKFNIVVLSGELNAETCSTFERLFDGISLKTVILDLTALRYISSAGLRSLIILFEKVKTHNNNKVILAGLNNMIREVIEVSGFDAIFELYDTLKQAEKTL